MSKTKVKQIYLLIVLIIGLIALVVYSTYAVFTLEGTTSNIVTIHTPSSLQISEEIYEYQQITIPKNSYITTDIDLYNSNDFALCYSIWYKIITKNIDPSLVKVYQITEKNIETSGVISTIDQKRIPLLITNDNEQDIKINIGITSETQQTSCILNINEDKSSINNTITNYEKLTTYIKDNQNKPTTHEEGYLTIKDISEPLELSLNNKTYISDKFTYHEELFTLDNPQEIELDDLEKYQTTKEKTYYTCLDKTSCQFLYQINATKKDTPPEQLPTYQITNYHILKGYLKGTSGIKEIIKNNKSSYIYYGDNPNNYLYFNCLNEQDVKTCELWQIIGTIYDEKDKNYITKIVRTDTLGLYEYNNQDDNNFNNSTLYNYLNKEYQLNNNQLLTEFTYQQTFLSSINNKSTDLVTRPTDITSKISIIDLEDYLNASTCPVDLISNYSEKCLKDNWLNKYDELPSWTLSMEYNEPTINEETQEKIIPLNNKLFTTSNIITLNTTNTKLNVRPIVYLKTRTIITSGDGTFDNPFTIR